MNDDEAIKRLSVEAEDASPALTLQPFNGAGGAAMIFGHKKLRLQALPAIVISRCAVCDKVAKCVYTDRDLRGHICIEDSAFILAAELALIRAHLPPPEDSEMEAHA